MESKSQKMICLLPLLFIAFGLVGQIPEVPRDRFVLSFSGQLEVSRGGKVELPILIVKSRGYQRSQAKMGVSSILPRGVKIIFNPEKGKFESSIASISIDNDAVPGEYMLILNATLNHKTKGSILRLLIN